MDASKPSWKRDETSMRSASDVKRHVIRKIERNCHQLVAAISRTFREKLASTYGKFQQLSNGVRHIPIGCDVAYNGPFSKTF